MTASVNLLVKTGKSVYGVAVLNTVPNSDMLGSLAVSIVFILKIALTALRCVRPIGRFVLLGLKPS